MFPLTRILSFAAAGALVAFTAASVPGRADESAQNLRPMPQQSALAECHLLRRAVSRRACQARLWRGVRIDTAESK
jgi:hypothetical protein